MERSAKAYIYSVIAAGALLLILTLPGWSPADPTQWAVYLALSILGSAVKIRLPGMEGTYSFSFLFLLYGVARLPVGDTLVAGCAAAIAQSLWRPSRPPALIQVLFNVTNVVVSLSLCFLIVRVWLSASAHNMPLVMALVACAYFMINTFLVSGALSLIAKQPFSKIWRQWYVWSFPYYLAGVTVVGLLPTPGRTLPREAWLILIPSLYLVHFFLSLVKGRSSAASAPDGPDSGIPRQARLYIGAVVLSGLAILLTAAADWRPENLPRFITYLALAVLASTLKIRLPQMRGTLTPAFVLVLAAIAQLSLAETAVMASLVGLVQVLWRAARRPTAAQVAFSPACLVISSSFAWLIVRGLPDTWLSHSGVGAALLAALVLYLCNTFMVAVVLALVEGKSLSGVWRLCHFWAAPYYLVGAAAAGIMTAVSRAASWQPSLLILPLMALVYISYRAQLSEAASGIQTAA